MSQIIEKFDILNISEEYKRNIKLFYISNDSTVKLKSENKFNVFFVTKSDKTYGFGENSFGQLGFGHNNPVTVPTIIDELCNKNIVEFVNGEYHCIARTARGKVYDWGQKVKKSKFGAKTIKWNKPDLTLNLKDKNITQLSCGSSHTLALTNLREVYAWGSNKFGQLGIYNNKNQLKPIQVNGCDNGNVLMISCGSSHSMALSEKGCVFSWGLNRCGQLGTGNTNNSNKPKLVRIYSNEKMIAFEKISCGPEHSLLLSLERDIYIFGRNNSEKLGNQIIPKKIDANNKFVDIISHQFFDIWSALSVEGSHYVWGMFAENVIKETQNTKFETFIEIFKHYSGITVTTIDSELYDLTPKWINGRYGREFDKKALLSSDGSFGIVFKALNRKDSKKYAIKKIALSYKESKEVFRELLIMKKLNSYHVVRHIDSWIENNYYLKREFKNEIIETIGNGKHILKRLINPKNTILLHIQMEYCYKTLREIIVEPKAHQYMDAFRYFRLCSLLIEILESVDYLHKQNPPIIHRDLKPENILLTTGSNGRFIRIADFGLAVNHDFENQSHPSGMGTREYMAPETISSKRYNTKADIYSLGIIIGEMFGFENETFIRDEDLFLVRHKYCRLKNLRNKMKAYNKNFRPDCDQILKEKHEWSLSLNDLEDSSYLANNIDFQQILDYKMDIKSRLDYFYYNFIQQKYELYKKVLEMETEINTNEREEMIDEIDTRFLPKLVQLLATGDRNHKANQISHECILCKRCSRCLICFYLCAANHSKSSVKQLKAKF